MLGARRTGTSGLQMLLGLATLTLAVVLAPATTRAGDDLEDRVQMLERQLNELKAELAKRNEVPAKTNERLDEAEDRIDEVELKQGKDRVNFGGFLRVTADSIHGDLAERLLSAAGVAVTPGMDFGRNQPERYLRFAYTTSLERLREGVQRIDNLLRNRKKERAE